MKNLTTNVQGTRIDLACVRTARWDGMAPWMDAISQMEVGAAKTTKLPDGSNQMVWAPGSALGANSSAEFAITFRTPDWTTGRRVFFLDGFASRFIEHAWINGLAILAARIGLSAEAMFAHRMMWFLFQRVQSTREALGGRFLGHKSLKGNDYRSVGQTGQILPQDVSLNTDGIGSSWDLAALLQAGIAIAREFDTPVTSFADKLNFGLYAAARANPLDIDDQAKVATLVRLALFDAGPGRSATVEEKAVIEERFLKAFERHLDDENEPFDQWFSGPNNSIIGLLARTMGPPGIALNRTVVRQELLDRAWTAHSYVAQCLDAQFWAVMRSIDPPLTSEERQRFEEYYCPRPCWANLPLLLLHARLDVLRPIILFHFGQSPEHEWAPIAHRLLSYYVEMSGKRREIDRERKRQRGIPVDPEQAEPLSEEDSRRYRRRRRR